MPLVLDHHLVWNMIIYLAKQLLFFGLSANLRRIISPYTIGNRHSGAGESLIQSCGHNCIEIRSENFDFWLTVSIHIIRMLSGIPISVLVGFSLGGSRKWHILLIYIFIMYKGSKMKRKIVICFKKAFLVYKYISTIVSLCTPALLAQDVPILGLTGVLSFVLSVGGCRNSSVWRKTDAFFAYCWAEVKKYRDVNIQYKEMTIKRAEL